MVSTGTALVFYENDVYRLESELDTFLELSGARCTLLIDKDGHLVTRRGEPVGTSTDSIAALIAGSFAAKLLAVKRVSSNRGKRTAGVDGVVLETPAQKWRQSQQLNAKDYKPKPLRRIYIPKKNGKRRPLGIPVQADRAEQALELLALDPVSETLADRCSYGFRQGRSAQDAMAACFQALCQQTSAEWILEGDIRGCFDYLRHDWMVDHIPTDKEKLRAWLKAGYL